VSTKEDWKAAKAEVEAIEKERDALLAPTKERYDTARDRLEEIEEDCGELRGRCEGCSEPIFEGDRYSYDRMGGVILCEDCSPTWRDLLREPESFYDGEDVYYTTETANAAADAHVAAGGSLDDKIGVSA
jgi:hypothetical protein